MKSARLITLVAFFIPLLSNQWSVAETQQVGCEDRGNCSSCITSGPACIWCSTALSARCLHESNASNCPAADIEDPATSITVNTLPLDSNHQVSVSSVRLKLRVGEPQTFNVSVRAAENFPLDLYLLMDLSNSFRDDLITVKSIAPQLISAIGNLTTRFQVGFGTFVDKATAPFNSRKALILGFDSNGNQPGGEPSACPNTLCSRPVSYEHVVNLTNSSDLFDTSVQDLVISTSVDEPEGTLDAMMQAVVCTNVVGWREEARKVLLVMTDDLMHTAGDSRLAGIYRPNDGRCHTQYDPTENKILYTASTEYDYPSLEHMRMVLEQFGVVPVFAVTQEVISYFEIIAQRFNGFFEEITLNSENLVSVIENAFNQLVNSSRLEFPELDYLQIEVTPTCPPGSTLLPNTSECAGIGNNKVTFSVTVNLTRCPESGGRENITVFIRPAFGTFTLQLEGQCACDCEQNTVSQSPVCSQNGNLTCGQCSCSEGWSGSDCSCSTASCPNGPNGLMCSGRGTCNCGQCVCAEPTASYPGVENPMFFGEQCECDNFQCLVGSNGDICSGKGTCQCDTTCTCDRSSLIRETLSGTSCECDPSFCVRPSDKCRSTNNCTLCNGAGTCNPCSTQGTGCSCNASYTGNYCDIEVPELCTQTESLRECVICYSQAANSSNVNCPTECNNYIAIESIPNNGTLQCSFSIDLCTYTYTLDFTTDEIGYRVPPPSCFPLPIWAIAVIITVVLLLIGIFIIVVIRLIILLCDHMEYKRFEHEIKRADLTKNMNPLYVSPETDYKNVAYKN